MIGLSPFVAILELGSAWMLGWLAAAGIPLAIHLLHRRRQQEIAWAAMQLLMQAIKQNSRTVRIEQWLLLLLRTATCLLFAIALARPWISLSPSSETTETIRPKLWIVVLDASYSMGYTVDRQSVWELAQQRASDLVAQAGDRDGFIIIQLSEPSTAVIAQPSFERKTVVEQIQRLECTHGGGELSSCLQIIRQAVDDARQSAIEAGDIHIVFFTDLGRDTWQSAIGGVDSRPLQELSEICTLRIDSFENDAPSNLAVTAFSVDAPVALRGRPVRMSATVHNYSQREVKRLPVQFQSEGKTLHTEFVDFPAGQSRTVETELEPASTGYWNATVLIPSDRLEVDNRRELVLAVKPNVKVALVEEKAGAARLIQLSLAPQATNSSLDNSSIESQSWSADQLQTESLAELDAIVIVDPSELNSETITKLQDYVSAGGAVLAALGPKAQPVAWNRPSNSANQMFGFELRQPSPFGDWRVDPMNYASPIAKPFANFLDAGLLTTPIFRYWQIAPSQAGLLRIDLGFSNGDPWLLRRPIGSGWAAALLSNPESGSRGEESIDEPWNAMATWPSFLPIMQKTLETIIGGSEQALNLFVGQPLQGTISERSRVTEIVVRRPDSTSTRLTVAAASADNQPRWSLSSIDLAGVYRVTEDQSETRPYAVNIVPIQSDLQSIARSSLPLASMPPPSEPRATAATINREAGQSEWLSQACLIGVLMTLASESVLAWSSGRRLI